MCQFTGGILMKKCVIIFVVLLAVIFGTSTVYAQHGGFTGPQAFGQFQAGLTGNFGFMGPSMPITVANVVQTFPNKATAILRGYIVQQISNDRYLFRDSTGEMIIKIKNDRWWGLTVGPNDLIEIGGEVKRDKRSFMLDYFDAKNIRLAI